MEIQTSMVIVNEENEGEVRRGGAKRGHGIRKTMNPLQLKRS